MSETVHGPDAAWRAASASMLLGAAQGGVPTPMPGSLAGVQAGRGAAGILASVASATAYRMASREPLEGFVPFPELDVAADECSPAATELLLRILAEAAVPDTRQTGYRMLQDWVAKASKAGKTVPAEVGVHLIEKFPDLCRTPGCRIVLGGLPGWVRQLGHARPAEVDTWDSGSLRQRCTSLEERRGRNPAGAREALAAVWETETADARAALLETLLVGVSAGDEDFAEAALDDRSERVREVARRILVSLPSSAYAARAEARARAAVQLVHVRGRPQLRLSLPDMDASLKRDGYQAGVHRHVLSYVVSQAPRRAWSDHPWGGWLEAARNDQASVNIVFEGWLNAAAREEDEDWAIELGIGLLVPGWHASHPSWSGASMFDIYVMSVLAIIRTRRGEALATAALTDARADRDQIRRLQLASRCRWQWSQEFTRTVLAFLVPLPRKGGPLDFRNIPLGIAPEVGMYAEPACEPDVVALAEAVRSAAAEAPDPGGYGAGYAETFKSDMEAMAQAMRTRASIDEETRR